MRALEQRKKGGSISKRMQRRLQQESGLMTTLRNASVSGTASVSFTPLQVGDGARAACPVFHAESCAGTGDCHATPLRHQGRRRKVLWSCQGLCPGQADVNCTRAVVRVEIGHSKGGLPANQLPKHPNICFSRAATSIAGGFTPGPLHGRMSSAGRWRETGPETETGTHQGLDKCRCPRHPSWCRGRLDCY